MKLFYVILFKKQQIRFLWHTSRESRVNVASEIIEMATISLVMIMKGFIHKTREQLWGKGFSNKHYVFRVLVI